MVVSDASPLINLAAIGHLDLLRVLYGTVCIPNAVHREITRFEEQPGADAVQSLGWVKAQSCPRPDLATALSEDLDVGEAEAIALAVDTGALLLIDEREGRRAASRLDVSRLGLLGVLVEAKRAGHIPVLRPLLRSLRQDAGFWMSEALQDRVLEKVNER
jgi:predicted nucleic acid-binding protein